MRAPRSRRTSLFAHGEPMVWLAGGALILALLMIAGLLGLVLVRGMATFWPGPVVLLETHDGQVMGEVVAEEQHRPDPQGLEELPEGARARVEALLEDEGATVRRRHVRIGNFELTGEHFRWISDLEVRGEEHPPWALVVERQEWGRFYGVLAGLVQDGEVVAADPAEAFERFQAAFAEVRERRERRRRIERHDIGGLNRRIEQARLAVERARRQHGAASPQEARAQERARVLGERLALEDERFQAEIRRLDEENARHALRLLTAGGKLHDLPLAQVVRAWPANRLGATGKLGVYLAGWGEFLTAEPREANTEGGVWPAIFGTVVMTLLMSVLVVPIGVLAALYLREYARAGPVVSLVRIAINNLAGVPSIVFGVFGLGFFCYFVGVSIDELFFAERLPSPTYGKGGILWASLTLALLTLPVVIVATEEALAAVPSSMREGSYACGASKWQTIRRIVLPRALPGILTGMILAVARGAGEVAPLMLVGAVKMAPDLPVDGVFPYVHPERSFMHLGFHVYDLGFQSPNSEAARPMVFTTTLLLIGIVVVLNAAGMWMRAGLRRRYGMHA